MEMQMNRKKFKHCLNN